jgi:hypothetical protein
MKKIYVAGPISAPSFIEGLENIKRGIEMGAKVLSLGYSPFTPMLDYNYFLQLTPGSLSLETMYNYSMEWLIASDAVLVLPNWEHSRGTHREIDTANRLDIPVFYNLKELIVQMPPEKE